MVLLGMTVSLRVPHLNLNYQISLLYWERPLGRKKQLRLLQTVSSPSLPSLSVAEQDDNVKMWARVILAGVVRLSSCLPEQTIDEPG